MMGLATVIIDKGKLAAADSAVVKREEFSALIEAADIIKQAHSRAQSLKAQMHEKVEAATHAGYEAGMQQASAEFATSVAATVAELESAFARLELRIVNTVMSALQQILGQLDDRSVMERLVRRVLSEARERKQLRLRVAPAQYDEVNQWLSEVIKEYPDVEFIDVLRDPTAEPGSCILETEFGVIDASVGVQLAAVRRGLMSAFIDKRVATNAARE